MTIFILSFIIIGLAAVIQGITSFGFSLLAVPLLALILPLDQIVPMLVVFSLLLNIIVFTRLKGTINKKQMIILVTFGLIAIPFGTYALKVVNEEWIKLTVGIIVIISSVAMNFGLKVKFKNQNLTYGLTGLLSGVLNGAAALSGPPVILLLSNEGVNKESFRKTLATYFMILNFFTIPIFLISGFLTSEVMLNSAKLLPALLIGTLTGIGFGNKLPDHLFKKITLGLIFIMGILTLISAF